MNRSEAMAKWASHAAEFASRGVVLPGVVSYMPTEYKNDFKLAMDSQPQLVSTPSGGLPSYLTTMIDPSVLEILLAPNKGAEILGEVRKGDWLTQTIAFPVVEMTGEATAYDDYSEGGSNNVNVTFPERQNFIFSTMKEFGDRDVELMGLAKINLVAQKDRTAVNTLNKFSNLTYFFGVAGLQNYGLVNDPSLAVNGTLTPAAKSAGGVRWILANGAINATANEIFADIQSLFAQVVSQTAGTVEATDELVLGMSPTVHVALGATNAYGLTEQDMLKKVFPKLRVVTAVQYGVLSASNTQGITAGNLVQLIAPQVQGQDSGYCAFSEKMRTHAIARSTSSSWKQKVTGGSYGAVVRIPAAFAQMLGA